MNGVWMKDEWKTNGLILQHQGWVRSKKFQWKSRDFHSHLFLTTVRYADGVPVRQYPSNDRDVQLAMMSRSFWQKIERSAPISWSKSIGWFFKVNVHPWTKRKQMLGFQPIRLRIVKESYLILLDEWELRDDLEVFSLTEVSVHEETSFNGKQKHTSNSTPDRVEASIKWVTTPKDSLECDNISRRWATRSTEIEEFHYYLLHHWELEKLQ
jgi:hypothetical protein